MGGMRVTYRSKERWVIGDNDGFTTKQITTQDYTEGGHRANKATFFLKSVLGVCVCVCVFVL